MPHSRCDPDLRGVARRLNARAAHLPDEAFKIVMRGSSGLSGEGRCNSLSIIPNVHYSAGSSRALSRNASICSGCLLIKICQLMAGVTIYSKQYIQLGMDGLSIAML